MFLLKWPLWMSQNMLCSLKDKVHEFFYIKRVIGKLRVFSQRWMVPLRRQARTKPKVTEGVSFLQKWIHFTLAKATILTYAIQQRLASFFHRGPNNIFSTVNICSKTQMLCQGNAQAKPDNMQANVAAPNKTLFTKAMDGPDLYHRATVCWRLLYIKSDVSCFNNMEVFSNLQI